MWGSVFKVAILGSTKGFLKTFKKYTLKWHFKDNREMFLRIFRRCWRAPRLELGQNKTENQSDTCGLLKLEDVEIKTEAIF